MNLVLTRATFPSSTCTPPNGVFYQLDNDSGDVDMFAVKRKSRAQIRPPPYRRKKTGTYCSRAVQGGRLTAVVKSHSSVIFTVVHCNPCYEGVSVHELKSFHRV